VGLGDWIPRAPKVRTGTRSAEYSIELNSDILMIIVIIHQFYLKIYHSPARHHLPPIKPPSKLALRLHDLPLQNRKLDNTLTILRPDSRKPYTLCPLSQSLSTRFSITRLRALITVRSDLSIFIFSHHNIGTTVYHNICREFVPPHMTDEIYPYATRPLVVLISV